MNPSSTPSPSGSNNNTVFLGCLGLSALVMASYGMWYFDHLPEQKEYMPPDQLELTTQPVPLSRQILVLVDDHLSSLYFDSIQGEVRQLASGLTEDQQICLFQVVTDQSVFRHEPWCSAQIKSSWWVMPEIKPAPYADQAEEKAYVQARAKLEAELEANLMRVQDDWTALHWDRLGKVEAALWQLPEQPYRSLADSLIRLMEVRRPTSDQPAEVVIYSPMVDSLYGPAVTQEVNLSGAEVRIRVMSSEGEVGLTRAVTQWGPWFNSGHPAKLDWSILEPKPGEAIRQSKAVHPAPGFLPPVVPKAPADDRTNVIRGELVVGDTTSMIRGE